MPKHYMMLSDLYGRTWQTLREHGDAPIGKVKAPLFPNEAHLPIELVEPHYPTFSHVTTDVGGVMIETYEVNIETE